MIWILFKLCLNKNANENSTIEKIIYNRRIYFIFSVFFLLCKSNSWKTFLFIGGPLNQTPHRGKTGDSSPVREASPEEPQGGGSGRLSAFLWFKLQLCLTYFLCVIIPAWTVLLFHLLLSCQGFYFCLCCRLLPAVVTLFCTRLQSQ